jgi:hypothetical protein
MIKFICPACGNEGEKSAGHYNRAIKMGCNVYCSRMCAGVGRRTSVEEKKKVKAVYDSKYRKQVSVKQKKRDYFKRDYAANPDKYKKERQRRYLAHLEYLKTTEYKNWKQGYDKVYRAKKDFGEFSEAALILIELEKELDSKDIKYAYNITQNKSSQKRKRKWKSSQQLI